MYNGVCVYTGRASFSFGHEKTNTLFLWPNKRTHTKYVATEITSTLLMGAKPLQQFVFVLKLDFDVHEIEIWS